ncbi:MAG: type III pantothenate kinase [Bacteroidales bacterium]|nr:type III pantothenate kinase [Bacteroidales bacterium]
MNLLIDIGNTLTKIGIYHNNKLIDNYNLPFLIISDINNIKNKFPDINNVILSSVAGIKPEINEFLKNNFENYIQLNSETKIPLEIIYKTRNTLGNDRIAGIVGANNIFPNTNVLVIDIGTAITYDFVNSKNQFLGGNISPGLTTRYKSLNNYTKNLPLLNWNENFELLGNTTKNAIISGVQNGIVFEIEGYINKMNKLYKNLKIILTGGDSILFEKIIKSTIFAELNLIFIGLNRILKYNVKNT